MKYIKLFEELNPDNKQEILNNDYRIVYRGGRRILYNGMFFSEDEYHANTFSFGEHVRKYKIFTGKVLNLTKYNDEIIKNIDVYGYHFYFQMHSSNIKDKWSIYLNNLRLSGDKGTILATRFEKEFEECDSIYGSDSGFEHSDVWYIKNKNHVEYEL